MRAVVALGLLTTGPGCHVTRKPAPANPAAAAAPQPHPSPSELTPAETAVACFAVAEEAEKADDDASAIRHLLRARSLDPGLPNLARRLAYAYERQGDLIHAIEEYGNALRESPKDPELLNDLGYCYYTLGDWKAAEENLRKSIAKKSRNPRAWNNLGLALGQQGRIKEAREAFSKAVSPAEAESNLGFVLLTQGKKAEAEQSYRRALELKPDLSLARVNLADLAQARLIAGRSPKDDPAIQSASLTPTAATKAGKADPGARKPDGASPTSRGLPPLDFPGSGQ